MIYDLTATQTGLVGLVGWRMPQVPEFAIVEAANEASSSGLFFQGFNKLVTISNLRNSLPEELSDAEFNEELRRLTNDAIAKVLLAVIQKKKPQVKDLLERFRLFDRANVRDELIDNVANTFVGYEIDPARNNNLKAVINAIGTEFDGVATFDIYLFHSSKTAPVATKSVTTLVGESSFTSVTDFIMPYLNGSSVGGKWYVGYQQDDLGAVKAQNRGFEDSDTQNASKYLGIRPIVVEGYTGTNLFDIADVKDSNNTHGLNFKFSVSSDFTGFFIDQKNSFANLIGYQVAMDVLHIIINSTRNNEIKKETRNLAMIELKGTDERPHIGLEWQLAKAIKETEYDLSAIDPLLLAPRNRFSFAGL